LKIRPTIEESLIVNNPFYHSYYISIENLQQNAESYTDEDEGARALFIKMHRMILNGNKLFDMDNYYYSTFTFNFTFFNCIFNPTFGFVHI